VKLEIRLPAYDQSGRAYLTWRPVKATVRLPAPPPGAVPVRLRSTANPDAGRLSFAPTLTHLGKDSIDLMLPADGRAVEFWVGGKFGFPSIEYGDVAIEAQAIANGQPAGPVLARHPLMVRVRKNANRLGAIERDRFLAALATLNGQGQGIFRQYRDTHVDQSRREAHGGPAFLPWHRAYLLDLERELQRVDGRVALPYWRFDEAAPNVFSTTFMGLSDNLGRVGFAAGHPLLNWSTDGQPGILRGGAVGPSSFLGMLHLVFMKFWLRFGQSAWGHPGQPGRVGDRMIHLRGPAVFTKPRRRRDEARVAVGCSLCVAPQSQLQHLSGRGSRGRASGLVSQAPHAAGGPASARCDPARGRGRGRPSAA
jgi:hypothetical protein